MILHVRIVMERHIPAFRPLETMFFGFTRNHVLFLGISKYLEILVIGDPRIVRREVLLHNITGSAWRSITGNSHVSRNLSRVVVKSSVWVDKTWVRSTLVDLALQVVFVADECLNKRFGPQFLFPNSVPTC